MLEQSKQNLERLLITAKVLYENNYKRTDFPQFFDYFTGYLDAKKDEIDPLIYSKMFMYSTLNNENQKDLEFIDLFVTKPTIFSLKEVI